MRFGVVGDVHGDFDALDRVVARHGDVAFWLSVGDVAGVDMRYPEPRAPLYWIQGNNEDFDFVSRCAVSDSRVTAGGQSGDEHAEARSAPAGNLRFLPNGTVAVVAGTVVAGLGGTFAPTWYDTPPGDLPFPGTAGARSGVAARRARASARRVSVRDDKRRHFVRAQVDALKAMRGVDVLLTHEAPRPFIVQAGAGRRLDAGKAVINELLAAMRPRLHFFGHHHRFSDAVREGVRSIGLDLLSQSYVLVDAGSLECERLDT